MAQRLIKTSVRELVSFVLRSGDLVRGGFVGAQRLAAGTRGHQQVQRSRPAGYQAEVPVSYLVERDGLMLEISGRVDGLISEPERFLLEEIKTTELDLDAEHLQNATHWAQAKIYAFILATQAQREVVDVRLTYVRLTPFATLELEERCTLAELAPLFAEMVDQYLRWARRYADWCRQRDASIDALKFPFARMRRGQAELMAGVERAISQGACLFAQAPTGVGKTLSTLFPAIRALGTGRVEKIFYLTPKTVVRTVAEKATDDLRTAGLRLKALTLTARERICFQTRKRPACDPADCPFARGYYDRIEAALDDAFARDSFSREVLEELARRHQVCPFELSLELSLWSDLIICDYNYVFDPRAYLRRFFQDGGGQYALLIDEAHNLVDRAREMYSAHLEAQTALALKRRLLTTHPRLATQLDQIRTYLRELPRDAEEVAGACHLLDGPPPGLLLMLEEFLSAAETVLARNLGGPDWEALLDFYFEIHAFLRVAEIYGRDYVAYLERHGRALRLRLFCLDPARNLREALRRGRAAVFFSATLTPLTFFRDLLGGGADAELLDLETPFPAAHLHLLVADQVATTYRERAGSYDQIAAAVHTLVSVHPGNYMVFFPSYRYLEAVKMRFLATECPARTLVQTPGMSETQRADFLDVFAADNADSVVGFVVMGGLFGEGIDLIGERLVGAVVVGVGLPQLCVERDLIRAYYDAEDAPGWNYAYAFPGMNRVLQAVGRVIRSEQDRGAILLVDQRFAQERYQRLFPRAWRPVHQVRTLAQIKASLELFWNGVSEPRYVPLDE